MATPSMPIPPNRARSWNSQRLANLLASTTSTRTRAEGLASRPRYRSRCLNWRWSTTTPTMSRSRHCDHRRIIVSVNAAAALSAYKFWAERSQRKSVKLIERPVALQDLASSDHRRANCRQFLATAWMRGDRERYQPEWLVQDPGASVGLAFSFSFASARTPA
jgi:hypothetical protein